MLLRLLLPVADEVDPFLSGCYHLGLSRVRHNRILRCADEELHLRFRKHADSPLQISFTPAIGVDILDLNDIPFVETQQF